MRRKNPVISRTVLVLGLLVSCTATAVADYVEVRRSAVVRAHPSSDAEEVFRPEVGSYLPLLSEEQTNGYYHVLIPSTGESGWVYRTLVRRRPGEPPAASTTGSETAPPRETRGRQPRTKKECVAHYKNASISDCPQAGCGGDPELNKKKNRTDSAQGGSPESWTLTQIIDLDEETPRPWRRGAQRDALEDVGEGTAVVVKGYLINAHLTRTPESCNCYLKGEENNDYHLNLVTRTNGEMRDSFVLEITPRLRPAGWTLGKLESLAEQKAYVRVTGWLLYDSMHPGASAHRATPWEIHPVTKFEICTTNKKSCDQGQGWRELENYP